MEFFIKSKCPFFSYQNWSMTSVGIEQIFLAGLSPQKTIGAPSRAGSSRGDHSALKTSLSAFPGSHDWSDPEAAEHWTDKLDHADNFQTKRNLALMVVQEIIPDASGEINMSSVMTECYKWRLEFLSTSTILKRFWTWKLRKIRYETKFWKSLYLS